MGRFALQHEVDGPVTEREGRGGDAGIHADRYRAHRAQQLAGRACDLAARGDEPAAREAVDAALAMLPWLADADAARVRRWVGEALVRIGAGEAACVHLRTAVRLCEALGDHRGAAAARYAYGCARLARS